MYANYGIDCNRFGKQHIRYPLFLPDFVESGYFNLIIDL